jgi:two-component system sensor histidine kinase AlgZ
MGWSPDVTVMSAMRNPAILSATSGSTPPTPSERARAPLRAEPSLFDACQIGVVLRTVVFVEVVVAIAALFVISTPGEWLVACSPMRRGWPAGWPARCSQGS